LTEIVVPQSNESRRLVLATLAGTLLNLGLFVVLALFSPIAAGFCIGYILAKTRPTLIGSTASGIIAYGLLFAFTEAATGWTSDPLVIIAAVVIMTLLCVLGAILGSILAGRTRRT
jgi:hypothetical protein